MKESSHRSIRGAFRFVVIMTGLVLLATAGVFFSCGKENKEEMPLVNQDLPDQVFSDFSTVESDSGLVKWKLKAPVARVYNSKKLLVTEHPVVDFYDDGGNRTSTLTADKGEYNQETHDLTALGNVVVKTEEGYTLETESLVWVEGLGKIHSEDFVKVTREKDILTGYGLETDPSLKNVEILRDVKAYLKDEKGKIKGEIEEGK
ncbi:LPS export ABC transporter periplasmic protein LptC [bacterium]|nr:MAG: LPS export ABC transporter periplasmic protein LptC [bacterium]